MTTAEKKTSKKKVAPPLDKSQDNNSSNTLKKKKPLSPLLITTSLCALSALIFNFYNASQILSLKAIQTQSELTNHNVQQEMLAAIEKKLSLEQSSFNKKIDSYNQVQNQKFEAITKTLVTLSNDKRGNSQSWQLEKAGYLLSMAQLTLKWEKSFKPAIELLYSAEMLIKKTNLPNTVALRQTINNEISALKALPTIDTIGLLSQIHSINTQLSTLPFKKGLSDKTKLTNEAAPQKEEPSSAWKKSLQATTKALSKIVIIRNNRSGYVPLLSQKDKMYIIQELQVSLKIVEWAIINQKTKIYQLNLKQISASINKYFDDSSSQTLSLRNTLKQLEETSIKINAPDITRSFQQLTELMDGDQK